MKRKNWIWFAVAFVVLAAFVAGVALLRSGARHIAPTYSAPPPMQIETPVQQTPPKTTTEPEVEPSVSGVLDMGLLRERCQAVLGLEARNAYRKAIDSKELENDMKTRILQNRQNKDLI